MKKLIFGVLALALVAGVIYQLKTTSSSAGATTASVPETSQQTTANVSPNAAAITNEKVKAFVIGQISSEALTSELISEARASLTTAELQQLALIARDESQSQEVRRKSLYVLTQMGSMALPALTAVATTPMPIAASQDPHSADQIKQSFEAGLRVTAIEALDELGTNASLSPAVKDSMLNILKVQKHRSLTLLAQISLSGIESGRPGKVKRAVDDLLKEKE